MRSFLIVDEHIIRAHCHQACGRHLETTRRYRAADIVSFRENDEKTNQEILLADFVLEVVFLIFEIGDPGVVFLDNLLERS